MFYERKMFWVLSGVALTTLVTLWAAGQNGKAAGLDNTACPVPVIMEHQQLSPYDVLSPVGRADITMIKQAPRLDTLNGKTIAVVGGSFMASVTHPEIRQLILENYPQAKVLLLGEIGSAGPYPAPGVKRAQKDEFERRLQELHVDAVISGNGGCGLCTPKEEGSCLTAGYLGIPSVMIAAPGFVEQARYVALTAGVPVQRVAVYPGAFSAHTTEELIRNTREILWPQIVEGLTKPIDSAEQKAAAVVEEYTADKVVFSGNLAEVQEFFEGQGWTDGQPIIPPTQAVVEEFFKYTPYGRDDVIGKIPPAYRQVTARHVAVVGAMAGCPPEYMPLLIAFTKAMQNGDFRRTLSSTHAWTPFMWLNGPVARQLGIDAGQGEISVPANKKLGRFIDLAMLNLGGYDVKKNRMGTFGYLSSWAMAEDEEALSRIGWSPYHMLHGFAANDSTVTAASSLNWGNNLTPATSNPDKIAELMAWDAVEKEQFALGGGTPFVYRTILVTEYVARDLAKKYKDKTELEQALIALARRPVAERAYANYWANPGSSFEGKDYSLDRHQRKLAREEGAKDTAMPPWLGWTGQSHAETVPVMAAGKTAIVVTGDANRNKVLTVPGGGMATVKIELPDNWDALLGQLGYKPLADYYIRTNKKTVVPQLPSVQERQKTGTPRFSGKNSKRNGSSKSQYNRKGQYSQNGQYSPYNKNNRRG